MTKKKLGPAGLGGLRFSDEEAQTFFHFKELELHRLEFHAL